VPRLDAERVALFRAFGIASRAIDRRIDAQLVEEFGLSLDWFDVMTALQRAGGAMRVSELRTVLDDHPSSLSRRLDRMEEEGWLQRRATPTDDDRRAVTVTLSKRGRVLWREANVAYRRAVQLYFARDLSTTDVAALQRMLGKWQGQLSDGSS
jgi:DNA-binding MarR family transcriptional regulator